MPHVAMQDGYLHLALRDLPPCRATHPSEVANVGNVRSGRSISMAGDPVGFDTYLHIVASMATHMVPSAALAERGLPVVSINSR